MADIWVSRGGALHRRWLWGRRIIRCSPYVRQSDWCVRQKHTRCRSGRSARWSGGWFHS